MSNMSYCRFRNTRNDLNDCLETLREEEELSEAEAKACKWMLEEVVDFLVEQGIVEDDGELGERLRDYFSTIRVEG